MSFFKSLEIGVSSGNIFHMFASHPIRILTKSRLNLLKTCLLANSHFLIISFVFGLISDLRWSLRLLTYLLSINNSFRCGHWVLNVVGVAEIEHDS